MGMAASQARFLGLTARMNNIEYEGQQINQQRTALSNKTASYYTDLLGMSVPTAPSVEEFTQTVYTFNDGALTNQITSLIYDKTSGKYNVSYIKNWTDDFSIVAASPSIITKSGAGTTTDPYGYKIGGTKLRDLDNWNGISFTVKEADGSSKPLYLHEGEFYTSNTDFSVANKYTGSGEITKTHHSATKADGTTPLYSKDGKYYNDIACTSEYTGVVLEPALNTDYYKSLSVDQLKGLSAEEATYQGLLNKSNGDSNKYFVRYVQNTSTGEYEAIFYNEKDIKPTTGSSGPVYDERNNTQSFVAAYKVGSAERVEEIKGVAGCELEQDSTGRYINIKIDGKTYALTTNTVTDQQAYDDAMNQYEYDKALYDQSIEEINAKIEIIQAEDKNLELRLKQLDTEHNAVSNEKDAVEKVIQKAVEGGFKTFG